MRHRGETGVVDACGVKNNDTAPDEPPSNRKTPPPNIAACEGSVRRRRRLGPRSVPDTPPGSLILKLTRAVHGTANSGELHYAGADFGVSSA